MNRRRRPRVLAAAGIVLLVGTFLIGALAAPSLAVDSTGDRQTLVGSQSTEGGWHEGGTVFMLDGETETWREDSAVNYFDVTMLEDERVIVGFSHPGYENCGPYSSPCSRTGYRIIDPDATGGPTVVDEWSFPVRSAVNSEVHDVEVLSPGRYLLADMDRERILEVTDGEVTWQWNASSFYTPPVDPTRTDWLHINDVDAINETHYLVSVRNANQLLVVSRSAGVVEVINADRGGPDDTCAGQLVPDESGDVRCGDAGVLNHQHNPQWLGDGAVLVADSDNHRAVELHRNETAGHWGPVWSVGEAAGVDLEWPRDADRLPNGNTLITDTLNSRVVEVDENGTAVWTAQLYNLPYEAERLPEGETVGAPIATPGGDIVEPRGDVPVLTLLVESMQGQFPILPFWFAEVHLALSMIAVVVLLGAGVDRLLLLRADRRARSDAGSSE